MLVEVSARYFCAGIIIENGLIREAAPILAWSIGKDYDYFKRYALSKGWRIVELKN